MTKEHPQNKYKAIDLLKFALDKEGIQADRYGIILLEDTSPIICEKTYLEELENDMWRVFSMERGIQHEYGRFSSYSPAVDYYFWRLIDAKTPWFYREQWEKETGQEFLLTF